MNQFGDTGDVVDVTIGVVIGVRDAERPRLALAPRRQEHSPVVLHQKVQMTDARGDLQELAVVRCRSIVEHDRTLETEDGAIRGLIGGRHCCLRIRKHSLAECFRAFVHIGGQHFIEGCACGCHRQRIAVERPDLVVATLTDCGHDLLGATDCTARHAPAERLGQRHDVGGDSEQLGGSTPTDDEATLHLIEREEHAMLLRQLAHALEIAGLRRDDARVHHHRFDDHPGDLATILVEHSLEGGEVVVRHDAQQIGHFLHHARTGHAKRLVDRTQIGFRAEDRHHRRVVMAVVRALDLHYQLATGDRAHQVERIHRRFRTRVTEAPLR